MLALSYCWHSCLLAPLYWQNSCLMAVVSYGILLLLSLLFVCTLECWNNCVVGTQILPTKIILFIGRCTLNCVKKLSVNEQMKYYCLYFWNFTDPTRTHTVHFIGWCTFHSVHWIVCRVQYKLHTMDYSVQWTLYTREGGWGWQTVFLSY